MRWTIVRRDLYSGDWLVSCTVCGRLGRLLNFWPASRMAKDHDAIHEPDDLPGVQVGDDRKRETPTGYQPGQRQAVPPRLQLPQP